jgi:hypothetical protein
MNESERIQMSKIPNQQDEKDDSGIEQDNSFIYIRISVEDHHLQKVLKFNLDDTVWSTKLKVLQVLVRVKLFFIYLLIILNFNFCYRN